MRAQISRWLDAHPRGLYLLAGVAGTFAALALTMTLQVAPIPLLDPPVRDLKTPPAGWQPAGEDDGRRPIPPVTLPAAYDAPAPREIQRLCDPSAEAGAVALAQLLATTWPEVGSSGIERPCARGGRSEHKEGRAYDWATRTDRPLERDAAHTFLSWLTAPGTDGGPGGNARRLGVRYVIWDRHIWTIDEPRWESYSGPSPHTDHVHITLSWAGARAQTSFWTGRALSAAEVRAAAPPIRVIGLSPQGLLVEPLKMGDVGPAVLLLRSRLGLTPGKFDPTDLEGSTSFDQETWNAITRLERSLGVTQDGVVEAREWAALDPAARPRLAVGSRGPAVERVQDALGMNPPPGSRGVFGANTAARVREAQAAAGLPQTGVVDEATWELLSR